MINREYPLEFDVGVTPEQYREITRYFPDTDNFAGYHRINSSTIRFSVRMIPYVLPILHKLGIKSNIKDICTKYSFDIPIDTSEQDFLRSEQYEYIKTITKKSGGLIQLHTSYGKNTMITYMLKHYTGTGNILIVAPTNSILEEIISRANTYNVKLGDSIRGINSTGFMNSKYKNDDYWTEFLAKVDLIIVDESENVTNSLEAILRKYCTNYRCIYGFSATANKYYNQELLFSSINMRELMPETISLLYFFGQSLCYKTSRRLLNINVVHARIPPEVHNPYKGDNYNMSMSINNAIMNNSTIHYINYINKHKNSVLMIPVKTNEQGEFLFNAITNSGISDRVVMWTSTQILCSIEGAEPNSYEDIKTMVDNHKIDILICTKIGYSGVDFQEISDILLMVGSRNNIVNQIVGRSERFSGEMTTWILKNSVDMNIDWYRDGDLLTTPIFNACNGARIKQLKSGHVSFIRDLGLLENLGD